jgi:uncharacterized protein YajQ (UPF0234 family)
MANDPMQVLKNAEAEIERRYKFRQQAQIEFRAPAALEILADEMTRIRAEMHTLRVLLATYAARAGGR